MTVVSAPKKDCFFFSEHATKQLRNRSNLSRSDVVLMMAKGLFIPVGKDKNRIHALIYSIVDDMSFVVIYDERNKEIITVLYVDYNNKFVIDRSIEADLKKKTIKVFGVILKKQTEWIKFFSEIRKNDKIGETVDILFVVKKSDGTTFEAIAITMKNSDFAGDVSQIPKAKFIRDNLENSRKRKNIEKDSIVQIITKLSTGKVIKLGYSSVYEKNKQKQILAKQLK